MDEDKVWEAERKINIARLALAALADPNLEPDIDREYEIDALWVLINEAEVLLRDALKEPDRKQRGRAKA